MFEMWPSGMWRFAEKIRILWDWEDSSGLRVNEFQSVFFRLIKLRWRGSGKFISKELPSSTIIGRWLELRTVRNSEYISM